MLRIALMTLFALAGLSACDHTPADPHTASNDTDWICSPDAAGRYHIGPDGMVLELCEAGCTTEAGDAICGG